LEPEIARLILNKLHHDDTCLDFYPLLQRLNLYGHNHNSDENNRLVANGARTDQPDLVDAVSLEGYSGRTSQLFRLHDQFKRSAKSRIHKLSARLDYA
jgi:hypothetical protein